MNSRTSLARSPRCLNRASSAWHWACSDGTVEIYSRFGAGDNPMLHLTHEGSWIGYGSAFRGLPPRVTTMARTSVLLARIPGRVMQDLLRERPEWWRFVAVGVLEYGDTAISAYADSLLPDSDRRCACTLLRIEGLSFQRRSRPERRSVPITEDELATLVNVSRTTLLQILRRFVERGLVEQAYRSLRAVDALRRDVRADWIVGWPNGGREQNWSGWWGSHPC